MFNTHITNPTRYIPTTVVEKRAPTDESVRLYGEFEKAAMDRIISSHSMTENMVSCRWVVFRDPITDNIKYRCQCKINGRDFDFEKVMCRSDLYDPQKMMRLVCLDLAEKLSLVIMVDLLEKIGDNPSLIKP